MSMHGPLHGRRIVVTRSRPQAASLRTLLEAEGADVIEFPTIRVAPLDDYEGVDRAIRRLRDYRWVIFTSQNGVRCFADRLRSHEREIGELAHLRLAAIGPATAKALETHGLPVSLAPTEFVAEALVDAFAGESLRGARMLLPRALDARSTLPDGLRAQGAIVDVVAVYRIAVEREQSPGARRFLLDGAVDALTFTSSSTVRNFVELLGPEAHGVVKGTLIACIGPVTAATARECGLAVGLVADTYTIPGLVAALRTRLGPPLSVADR
jgi:uroporphyrinogen III methyltransferase/synthase